MDMTRTIENLNNFSKSNTSTLGDAIDYLSYIEMEEGEPISEDNKELAQLAFESVKSSLKSSFEKVTNARKSLVHLNADMKSWGDLLK